MKNVKITNADAKRMLNNQVVIYVNDSSIDNYTDITNFYNHGIYGWNYSIGFNTRLDKWVICGYRIPQSVLNAASEIIKMPQTEARLYID